MARMVDPANRDDEAALVAYAERLADRVEAAVPGWVLRSVERFTTDSAVLEQARAAGERASIEVGAQVRDLLLTDIDEQVDNPLGLLRGAVRYATDVLLATGLAPVRRDEFAVRAFPDDVYGLAPATFADIDPSLLEPGIEWGAAKAHVHLARRRSEGLR